VVDWLLVEKFNGPRDVLAIFAFSLPGSPNDIVIHQLADLFFNLEFCEAAAVTPTVELAKLALVTSRDEEDDEVDRGGTDSSNDTEATLVDDGPSRPGVTESSSYSSERVTSTVLGKRTRDMAPRIIDMEVDSPIPGSPKDNGSYTIASSTTSVSPPPPSVASSSKHLDHSPVTKSDSDGDIEMEPALRKPPPLPPRKLAGKSESVMMFGMLTDIHGLFLTVPR
jgi:ubiquitin carboxyl-terminal hydrolase 25